MAQLFSKYQGFLRSPSTFLLLFFSVANFNKHNAFGNQPKTMFLCGMLKDEILYIVQKTILSPDVHTIERGGTHVAKKTFPYDVGEFVEFDQADKLCTRLLNVVKVVFKKTSMETSALLQHIQQCVSIKFPYEPLTLIMQLFSFSVERCQ